MKEKVLEVIDEMRPFLMNDGGNIEFVKIEDDIVYVKLQGACAGCPMREMTLRDGVEAMIMENVPQVKAVKLIDEE